MKIKIEKTKNSYRADLLDLPETPSVGTGKTRHEAVASLFYRLLQNELYYWKSEKWIHYLNMNSLEIEEE